MQYLLAIESSTPHLSVALFKIGAVRPPLNRWRASEPPLLIEEIYCAPDGRGHSEKLLPIIDKILSKNKICLDDLNALAVAIGPGSYTSLRVGLATVIGLALAKNLHIYPVSSLKTLAMGGEGVVAPVLKAGRGRIYAAVYEKNGAMKIDESVFTPSDFLSRIEQFSQEVVCVGPGVELIQNVCRGAIHCARDIIPRASNVGRLVFVDQIKSMPADQIRLRYLQEPDLGK